MLAAQLARGVATNGPEPEAPPHPADTADSEERHRQQGALSDWEWIDWSTIGGDDGELVDGFLYAGRWFSLAASAKTGKTTFLVSIGNELSAGRHPFDGTELPGGPVEVAHLDAEIGRVDLGQVVNDCGYDPAQLKHWHATDRPGILSTVEGAAAALHHLRAVDAKVVILDGLNGVVFGAEKDDVPWRAFYDLFVRPLKSDGRALITSDNTGHEQRTRPRGTSVKLDKPDAVASLARTASGVLLDVPWRRSSVYRDRVILAATGFDGSTPVRYRYTGAAWPAGTEELAAILEHLAVPLTAGRAAARTILRQAVADAEASGADPLTFRVRNDLLAAALRWRRLFPTQLQFPGGAP